VPHPLSIFQGVRMLPPAHLLVYRPGAAPVIRRYWDVDFSPSAEAAEMSEGEIVDRLLELLRRGVERRLMSDVPIGFFLSGGIDSSLSTVLAAELSSGPIKTFTLTYAGARHRGQGQDRRWALGRRALHRAGETMRLRRLPRQSAAHPTCFDGPSRVVSAHFLAQLIQPPRQGGHSGRQRRLFGSYLSHQLAHRSPTIPVLKRR
jgi:hypothetical protein